MAKGKIPTTLSKSKPGLHPTDWAAMYFMLYAKRQWISVASDEYYAYHAFKMNFFTLMKDFEILLQKKIVTKRLAWRWINYCA
jgi:hypothetical protein